jgi:hypothetical protein
MAKKKKVVKKKTIRKKVAKKKVVKKQKKHSRQASKGNKKSKIKKILAFLRKRK